MTATQGWAPTPTIHDLTPALPSRVCEAYAMGWLLFTFGLSSRLLDGGPRGPLGNEGAGYLLVAAAGFLVLIMAIVFLAAMGLGALAMHVYRHRNDPRPIETPE